MPKRRGEREALILIFHPSMESHPTWHLVSVAGPFDPDRQKSKRPKDEKGKESFLPPFTLSNHLPLPPARSLLLATPTPLGTPTPIHTQHQKQSNPNAIAPKLRNQIKKKPKSTGKAWMPANHSMQAHALLHLELLQIPQLKYVKLPLCLASSSEAMGLGTHQLRWTAVEAPAFGPKRRNTSKLAHVNLW